MDVAKARKDAEQQLLSAETRFGARDWALPWGLTEIVAQLAVQNDLLARILAKLEAPLN